MIGDDELERMWKEEVVISFKILSQYLPGNIEENHVKPQNSLSTERDVNPEIPGY
jgi:hypothetical protein